jgi:hypothetical protein
MCGFTWFIVGSQWKCRTVEVDVGTLQLYQSMCVYTVIFFTITAQSRIQFLWTGEYQILHDYSYSLSLQSVLGC